MQGVILDGSWFLSDSGGHMLEPGVTTYGGGPTFTKYESYEVVYGVQARLGKTTMRRAKVG